ncbi:unnamed protein product [Medioppia subpectinata]|uniref:Cytochrome b5 heme-binding domain-containing protein n=1 Tax=Medioppia subpectinata TaxID=1979941 RepID=A0A7R9Q446_9ACAR|nr:unnamed protein product [Medioppia subpectinata]CAG2112008.1 unnamed protein product [Medioppia subpectinata]
MCGAITTKQHNSDQMDGHSDDPKPKPEAGRRPSIVLNDDMTDISGGEPSGGNATGSGRTRVALKPGHSLMDWLKLCAKSPDLSGTGGQVMAVTVEELQKHNTLDDCWLSIRGKVYNVTQYLHFHPGGVDEMMRGAGSDATDLFNEIHRYVNYESMLKKCFVGPLVIE